MDSSTKNETNINNNKTREIKIQEKSADVNNSDNNFENNVGLSSDIHYLTEKNKIINKNNRNNNEKIVDNIRDMIVMSKHINKSINKLNKKISKENDKINNENIHKNLIILKYEDYKSNIRKYYTNIANKSKKKIRNLNKTNNLRTKNKLNDEFISVEKMFKKYNSKDWNEIYKKRFKDYQDNINKKKEEMRKIKEREKKRKEDELINYNIKNRSKSSRHEVFLNYKPFLKKEDKKEKKTLTNYFKKMLERKYELDKNKEHENNENIIYNNRYNDNIDKDLENYKKPNIININGKIYNLEEERKNLIAMSQRKNLFRSDSFKNKNFLEKNETQDLKFNQSYKKDIISETDKLIYEFFMRYLEEKNIYLN